MLCAESLASLAFLDDADRLMMLMTGEENIREVIAFPKTQKGLCLLTGAPSEVTDEQLEELSIKVDVIE